MRTSNLIAAMVILLVVCMVGGSYWAGYIAGAKSQIGQAAITVTSVAKTAKTKIDQMHMEADLKKKQIEADNLPRIEYDEKTVRSIARKMSEKLKEASKVMDVVADSVVRVPPDTINYSDWNKKERN